MAREFPSSWKEGNADKEHRGKITIDASQNVCDDGFRRGRVWPHAGRTIR